MKYTITTLLLLACSGSLFSQKWHLASDTLKLPKNNTGYYATVSYFNGYDTVPCTYVETGKKEQHKGFKFVYVLNDHYTDDANTWQVFYDDRMNRVFNVERYYFK